MIRIGGCSDSIQRFPGGLLLKISSPDSSREVLLSGEGGAGVLGAGGALGLGLGRRRLLSISVETDTAISDSSGRCFFFSRPPAAKKARRNGQSAVYVGFPNH